LKRKSGGYIWESDLVGKAIVALPTDCSTTPGHRDLRVDFVQQERRPSEKSKVQLIQRRALYQKMRKSLGSKRQEIGE